MEYGIRFTSDINHIFQIALRNVYGANNHRTMLTPRCEFKKGNVYSKFLISKVSHYKEPYEIPLIMREYSEDAIVSNHETLIGRKKEQLVDTLVFPLYVNDSTFIKSTFDTIIRCFFNYTTPDMRISKVTLKQSDKYWYGGRGIILDKDFNILLLMTIVIERDAHNVYQYKETICRLNPSLFPTKDIMSRGIVNKIVPFITQKGISTSYRCFRTPHYFGTTDTFKPIGKVTVIIDPDINNFIECPVAPMAGISEDDLHQCIIDNKMEIFKMISIT